MKSNEFQTQIQRLVDRYGQKFYPTEVVQLMFTTFGRGELQPFKNAITELIADNQFTPELSELIMLVKKHSRSVEPIDPYSNQRAAVENARARVKCSTCMHYGVFTAIERGRGYTRDFLCSCEIGKLCSALPEHRGMKTWSEMFEKTWRSEWDNASPDVAPDKRRLPYKDE